MTNILAFLITLAQLVLIALAYTVPWEDVFNLLVAHFSPVMVFLGLLETALEFTSISYWLGVGLTYCLVKYFIISRAIFSDGIGFFDVGALVMEVIYIAGSTIYIVYYSYL